MAAVLAPFRFRPRCLQDQAAMAPRDQLSTWVLAEPRAGLRLWLDLGDYGVSRPCLINRYEPDETAFVEQYLRPGMSFVDVGANIGWFSLIAAKALRHVSGVSVGEYVDLLLAMNYRPHRLGSGGRPEAVDRASLLATSGSQNFVFLADSRERGST
jgi:hypothetical protein